MITTLMAVNGTLTLLFFATVAPVWLFPDNYRAEAGHVQGLISLAAGAAAFFSWLVVTATFWFEYFT